MSSLLQDHLRPNGRSTTEPNMIPDVLDSDGNIVGYFAADRVTTEATVVDIGDSPNSNDGDALRTAFLKLNNFMEASYRTNVELNRRIQLLEQALDDASITRTPF